MVGGLSELMQKDDKITELVNIVKDEFENNNYNTQVFEADSYKSQVVNGVNYFIKVKTDKEYVHIRIHQSLPHNNSEVSYHSEQLNKKKGDEISYF